MKKIALLSVVALLCGSLYACNDNTVTESIENNNEVSTESSKDNTHEDKVESNTSKNEAENKAEENKVEENVEEDVAKNIYKGRIYYHEGFSGNIYYIEKDLSDDPNERALQLVDELKKLPENDYLETIDNQEFSALANDIKLNYIEEDKDCITIDFNKNFTEGLGSSSENSVTESIVNSFGYNYKVKKVIITFNGENYSSGHTIMEDGEYFETKYAKGLELKKLK